MNYHFEFVSHYCVTWPPEVIHPSTKYHFSNIYVTIVTSKQNQNLIPLKYKIRVSFSLKFEKLELPRYLKINIFFHQCRKLMMEYIHIFYPLKSQIKFLNFLFVFLLLFFYLDFIITDIMGV